MRSSGITHVFICVLFQNESSSSVPPSGMAASSMASSNALRTSSKTNIHNNGIGGAVGGLEALGKACEAQVRVSCNTGSTSHPNGTAVNGLVTILTTTGRTPNGPGNPLNAHSYSHVSGRSHRGSLIDLDGNTTNNGNPSSSTSNGLNGHSHHHGPTVASILNGVITNGPATLINGSTGSLRTLSTHKLPILHTNINS